MTGAASAWLISFFLLAVLLGMILLPACSPGAPPPLTAAPTAPATLASPTVPKTLTTSEIAMLDLTPERQKLLEERAKGEGEVMIYTSQTGLEPVTAAFTRKYPFIRAEAFQANISSLMERTRAEIAARRLGGDVLTGGLRLFIPLSDLLTPFKSPRANFSVIPTGAVSSATLLLFAYNTRQVPPAEVPQKLDDLLLPRWKGKIGFHAPPNTFPGLWTGMLIETLGEDAARNFLRKLGEQNVFFYQTGGAGMQALVSGEIHIGTQTTSSSVEQKKAKAPIDWVALEPTLAQALVAGIFEKSSHPYSAMLFLDFLLSPEGQKILGEESNNATMADIERGEVFGGKLPKRIKLESPDDEKGFKRWSEIFTELVVKKK